MKVEIDIDFIYSKVIVLLGDYADIKKMIPEDFESFGGDGYMARTVFRRIGDIKTICIHSRTAAMSVIAHEAVHASSILLDTIGAHADFNNDEVQAHLVQHICEKVERSLQEDS